jgi:ABC-2 type transport system ATP-binding protein
METMIETIGVGKRFGTTTALAGVDLAVPRGSILCLLGPNGAGKTTLVNVLATLARPSFGRAMVAGFDVVREALQVRRRIGLTGQFAMVEEQISGKDNLVLMARLFGASNRAARARADTLLQLFDLTAVAGRAIRTYSGGLRRRLDLAVSLVAGPEVLFLDEPTTGLDPTSRLSLWSVVQTLVQDGTTVLLTTQYLEEADRQADSIVVLAAGRIVASGSPADLKARISRRTVTVRLAHADELTPATQALRQAGLQPVLDKTVGTVTVAVRASRDLAVVVRALDDFAVEVEELTLTEPNLDEVYRFLTPHQPAIG